MTTAAMDIAFEALQAARATGEAQKLWVVRCPTKAGCWRVGAWTVRGTVIVAAARLKLGQSKADEIGLDRITPGRAWVGRAPDEPVVIGCDHGFFWAHLDLEGCRPIP